MAQKVDPAKAKQIAYLEQATKYYLRQNEPVDLFVEANEFYALAKFSRRQAAMRRLRIDLAKLNIGDFHKSNIVCDCGSKHHKLSAGDVLICPVSLGIQWARLTLNGYRINPYDMAELLEMAK